MKRNTLQRALSLLVLLALLTAGAVSTISAQGTPIAASTVKGFLGENGSKHYLGLKVIDPSQPIKVVLDYRQDSSALDGGAGFYIFNEQGFARFIGGTPGRESNLATGSLNISTGLKQKIAIISNPVGTFSIVPYNDSNTAFDYVLTAENALIVDDSGEQVTDPAAMADDAAMANDAAGETATEETATEEAAAAPEAEVAATETVTATVAVVATATPTPRPVAPPVITRSEYLQGDLDEQYAKHYFDLAVNDITTNVEISMSFDPQDQPTLDNGFNFYAYTSEQFQQLIRSGKAPSIAENTAAGTLAIVDGLKVMQATIAKPFKGYTIIVGNDSTIPVSYTITVGNGLLVDASGQSNTASMMMANGDGEEVAASSTTTATPATSAVTTTTKVDPTVSAGQTYVVKSGDTIATIARAAYGDLNLWDELCAYNSLENCDRIEVGQKITVPAKADLGTGAVAAPVAPAPVTAPVAATTATTVTVAATAPVTTTTAMTDTMTGTMTDTVAATSGTIIDVATNARQFEILLLALTLSNLTDSLKADGPFTLFAPTDAAFGRLSDETLEPLLADADQLAKVLQYHVVPQKLTMADITDGMQIETLMGQTLTFAVSGSNVSVNGALITPSELPASNGTVFIIDSVLLPAE